MFADARHQVCRYEFKYLIDEGCARWVRDFVRSHLRRDEHAKPAMQYSYPIFTLYLDDPSLTLYRATFGGHKNRFKLRIRYYDPHAQGPLFFEIKRRVNDVIIKDRAIVRPDALGALLNGHCPRAEDLMDPQHTDSFRVLHEFTNLRHALGAKAKVLVYYEREAWSCDDNETLRVTFDREAAAARFTGTLRPDFWKPLHLSHVVLELKFDDRYPYWMRELVQACDLYRVPMSKYLSCTDALSPPMQRVSRILPFEASIS